MVESEDTHARSPQISVESRWEKSVVHGRNIHCTDILRFSEVVRFFAIDNHTEAALTSVQTSELSIDMRISGNRSNEALNQFRQNSGESIPRMATAIKRRERNWSSQVLYLSQVVGFVAISGGVIDSGRSGRRRQRNGIPVFLVGAGFIPGWLVPRRDGASEHGIRVTLARGGSMLLLRFWRLESVTYGVRAIAKLRTETLATPIALFRVVPPDRDPVSAT